MLTDVKPFGQNLNHFTFKPWNVFWQDTYWYILFLSILQSSCCTEQNFMISFQRGWNIEPNYEFYIDSGNIWLFSILLTTLWDLIKVAPWTICSITIKFCFANGFTLNLSLIMSKVNSAIIILKVEMCRRLVICHQQLYFKKFNCLDLHLSALFYHVLSLRFFCHKQKHKKHISNKM